MKAKTSMKKSVITTILFCCILSSSFSQKRLIDTLFIANNKYPIERCPSSKAYAFELFPYFIFSNQYLIKHKENYIPFYNEGKCRNIPVLNWDGEPCGNIFECDSSSLDTLRLSDFIDSLVIDINSIKYDTIFIKRGLKKITIANCDFAAVYENKIIHYYNNDFNDFKYSFNQKPKYIILQNMIYYDEKNILYLLPAEFLIFLK